MHVRTVVSVRLAVVREPRRSLCGRHLSGQVVRRPPIFGDACPGRSHRDLRRAAGDEGGEDHPDGVPVRVTGFACEQQTMSSTSALRSGRDAGVGRVEAETVPALDRSRSFVQPASQVQEFTGAPAGGEASSEAPPGLRGQRRRYKEASSLEVEDRVHAQQMLVRAERFVSTSNNHSNDLVRTALRAERRVWQA